MDPLDPLLVRAVGGGLALGGYGLTVWTRRHLRRAGIETLFDMAYPKVPEEPATGGPYRLMNHPHYAGGLMMIAGVGLAAFGEWGGAALMMAAVPHYLQRGILEGGLIAKRKQLLLEKRVAEKLFEEMSQIGTEDEPSHEAHNEETE